MTRVVFDHVLRGGSPERPGHRHGSVTLGNTGVTSGGGRRAGVDIGLVPGRRAPGPLSATTQKRNGKEEAGKISQHATASLPPIGASTNGPRHSDPVAKAKKRGPPREPPCCLGLPRPRQDFVIAKDRPGPAA